MTKGRLELPSSWHHSRCRYFHAAQKIPCQAHLKCRWGVRFASDCRIIK